MPFVAFPNPREDLETRSPNLGPYTTKGTLWEPPYAFCRFEQVGPNDDFRMRLVVYPRGRYHYKERGGRGGEGGEGSV